jgi:DnaK suppressor protein
MAASSAPAASSGTDLAHFEKLLQERLDILRDAAAALEREEAGAEDVAGRATDPAEQGAELSTRELNLSCRESIGQEMREIGEALERVNAGAFGLCESCGATISPERLEAIPYATLCRECKMAEEDR